MIDIKDTLNWSRIETAKMEAYAKNGNEAADEKPDMEKQTLAALNTAQVAFETLLKVSEKGDYSELSLAKVFLGRLMKGLPLTPIENKDEEWEVVPELKDKKKPGIFRSVRYHDLYKVISVEEGGEAIYIDNSRFAYLNVANGEAARHDLVEVICGEGFQITMPYVPSEKKIVIYYDEETFGTDHVVAITHYMREGELNPRPISRFFKETVADECDYNMTSGKYVEIDKEKWKALKIRIEKNRKKAEEGAVKEENHESETNA